MQVAVVVEGSGWAVRRILSSHFGPAGEEYDGKAYVPLTILNLTEYGGFSCSGFGFFD